MQLQHKLFVPRSRPVGTNPDPEPSDSTCALISGRFCSLSRSFLSTLIRPLGSMWRTIHCPSFHPRRVLTRRKWQEPLCRSEAAGYNKGIYPNLWLFGGSNMAHRLLPLGIPASGFPVQDRCDLATLIHKDIPSREICVGEHDLVTLCQRVRSIVRESAWR